jgi:hypothetical protein
MKQRHSIPVVLEVKSEKNDRVGSD